MWIIFISKGIRVLAAAITFFVIVISLLAVDERCKDKTFPAKIKIGVSGCPNNCSESSIKDIGLTGMGNGWRVLAGGFASGLKPRLADVIASGLNDEEALALIDKIIEWFQQANKAKRLGRVIDEVGVTNFMGDLGLPTTK